MRSKKLFVGNWKMNKIESEAEAFLDRFLPLIEKSLHEVWIAPPYTSIYPMAKRTDKIRIGAQNIHEEDSGAFTGEVSGLMVKDDGASFVILGHSERRALYQESDELVNKKIKKALQIGLTPLLCVGETLDEHEEGVFKDVLASMLEKSLEGIADLEKVVIAYEPVWAIGTGRVATCEHAAAAHGFIRETIANDKVRLLYGGSVKKENVGALLECAHINGVLVGGASLDPETFASIINLP